MTPRWWMVATAAIAGASLAVLLEEQKPPRIVEHQVEVVKTVAGATQLQVKEVQGPTRTVERWHTITAATAVCPAQEVEHERVIEEGPRERDTAAVEAHTATESVREVLRVVEAPRASWAVYGGLQLYPEQLPVLGVGKRLFGPIWLEAWARPRLELALPAAGLQLRAEF